MAETKIFDAEGTMSRLDNDRELLQELVKVFQEEYPNSISAIRVAISSHDAKGLESKAHSIKGALGNIGAMLGYQLAFTLEKKGKSSDFSETDTTLTQLEESVEKYLTEYTHFIRS